jgi:beta-fructofuranosidase
MGDWWYLVFSEAPVYSRQVKYVMAKSWEELKTRLDPPAWPDGSEDFAKLDSRAFYAGKTASNGTDRYIWGWCPIRDNYKTDIYKANTSVSGDKEPAWGGALVCHRIVQHSDGKLSLGEVPGIKAKYNQAQSVSVMSSSGWANGKLSGDDAYVLYNRLGSHNHISLTVTTSNKWDKFGISVVRGTDSDRYYTMVVNPESESSRKINFEEEGKGGKGFIGGIDGYFFPTPEDNTYHIDIYTDNSVLVMYINDNVCYTQRIYGIQKNCWSVNNYGGSITVSDVKVSQY